jgi:hypothetical protein
VGERDCGIMWEVSWNLLGRTEKKHDKCLISGFRRDVDELCALLRHYVTWSGNPSLTFRDNLSVPSSRLKKSDFLALEDRTGTLSRNVGKGLPLDAT